MKSEDYTHRSWIGALALIAVLPGLSLIPPQRIGGVELRRANILSELIAFDDASTAAESEPQTEGVAANGSGQEPVGRQPFLAVA